MKKLIQVLVLCILFISILSLITVQAEPITQYEDYAEKLSKIGVFKGTSNGFELNREPTRLEAAVMFVRLLGGEKEALDENYAHPFNDVPWGDAYVGYLYKKGFTNGTTATTFGSNDFINAKSYITFILRSLGYNDSIGDFSWNESIEFARNNKLIRDLDYNDIITGTFYRGKLARISYLALKMPLKDNEKSLAAWLVNVGAIDSANANEIGVLHNKCTNSNFSERYGIEELKGYKGINVYSDSNLLELSNLLESEGLTNYNASAISKINIKYTEDRYLIIFSSEYSFHEFPPFIKDDLGVENYYNFKNKITAEDEFLKYSLGKATILIINKGFEPKQFDYLAPSVEVNFNSLEIKNLAEKITIDSNSDLEKSEKIYNWIRKNISYESYYLKGDETRELTYASNVLERKNTNCTGYSNLYAALCRASGIKARVVRGWSYDSKDKDTMYKEEYRHAWNEILINDEWINVDVTLGSFNKPNEAFFKEHIKDYISYY